ncbi:MAG: ABC transporter permease subunit, partial [Pseudomonadota bacterium]
DMLWNDSRYRSSFIQIVALFVTITMLYLIVQNVVDNLAALGKEFGFSFMQQPAGYDINQRPIDYNSRDSHARAAVIGIMNTLLVAIVGCFLATIIGVLAGVARLSKNWMLRSLMSVYVELVRNVPVLIQILLVSALITETMPAPRAFRGEDPVATMWLFDSVAATNRGFYFPAPVLGDGSWLVVTAFILAIVGAVIFGRWAMQYQQQTGEELPEKAQPLVWVGAVLLGLISLPFAYAIAQLVVLPFVKLLPFGLGLLVEALAYPLTPIIAVGIGYVFLNMRLLSVKAAIVLGVPLIVFILIWPVTGLPIGLELPSLQGFNFQGGIYARESYVSLTLALAIYTGGFIAENVRAGIQAV